MGIFGSPSGTPEQSTLMQILAMLGSAGQGISGALEPGSMASAGPDPRDPGPQPGPLTGFDPLGNIASNTQAGLGAILGSARPPLDPLQTAEASVPGTVNQRAADVQQIMERAPTAVPGLQRGSALPQRSMVPPIPEHLGKTRPEGGGTLLEGVPGDPNFQALSGGRSERARGQPGAGWSGSEFMDFVSGVAAMPMTILQRTVGAAMRGGDPQWMKQIDMQHQIASIESMNAEAEAQRSEEMAKLYLPKEIYQQQHALRFSDKFAGTSTNAHGMPGGGGFSKPKQSGIFEFLRSYQDEAAEKQREIIAMRGQAAATKSRTKDLASYFPTVVDVAQGQNAIRDNALGEKYDEQKILQDIAKGNLAMENTRDVMAHRGQGSGDGPLSASQERLRSNDAESALRRLADLKAGAGKYKSYSDEQRAEELGRAGQEVPFEEDYPGPDFISKALGASPSRVYDFSRTQIGGATSGIEAAIAAQIAGKEITEAAGIVDAALAAQKIDRAAGKRLMMGAGFKPRQ